MIDRDSPHEKDKRTKRTYSTYKNDNEKNTAYLKGKNLRAQAMFSLNKMYDIILIHPFLLIFCGIG